MTAEMTGVVNQPSAMRASRPQLMLWPPLARPIPITAPITACELETGTSGKAGRPRESRNCSSPCEAKMKRTIDWEITTIQAATGVITIIFLPIVRMILWERVKMPTLTARLPIRNKS